MTERKMSYLEGASLDDFFRDVNDVLIGASGTFTVCAIARAFPGFGPGGVGTAAPVGFAITNQPEATPEDEGYSLSASFAGFANLSWGDGAAGQAINGGGPGIIGGGAEGATACLHAVFDANADTVGLWFNGTFVDVVAGAGFVPSTGDTTIGVLTPAGALPFDGEIGVAGFGIADSVLSAQDIADHYNAVLQNDQMFDTGVFDALWDVRAGLPNIDNDTTTWLDEIAAAPLERVTTDQNFSMSVAAHKPRFQ
jgi:hypothetical protein